MKQLQLQSHQVLINWTALRQTPATFPSWNTFFVPHWLHSCMVCGGKYIRHGSCVIKCLCYLIFTINIFSPVNHLPSVEMKDQESFKYWINSTIELFLLS